MSPLQREPATTGGAQIVGRRHYQAAGKLSVKATPVRVALVFGLVMLKVSEAAPFRGIVAAPKPL